MFRSEVLPAPLGPMIDRMAPRGTSSDTSCTAVTPPNFFDTPATTSWLSPCSASARWADAPAMNPPYKGPSSLLPASCRLDLDAATRGLRHEAPHRLPDLRPRPSVGIH